MKRWNSKRIAFIAILIATSIAFVVIGAQAAAISSLPNFKLSLAGLPVKITGYLFGPGIGFAIGFITDIMTFLFVPVFYNPIYSVALGISGMIPGLFAWFYFKKFNFYFTKSQQVRKWNIKKIQLNHNLILEYNSDLNSAKAKIIIEKIKKIDNKILILRNKDTKEIKLLNANLVSAIAFTLIIGAIITILIDQFLSKENLSIAFESFTFLQNKLTFLIFSWIGFLAVILFLIICRFKMSSDNYIKMIPILMFIILTEFINIPLVALADQITVNINFWVSFVASFASSPIKIWFNLIIILFATKIVTPLIIGKQANAYN